MQEQRSRSEYKAAMNTNTSREGNHQQRAARAILQSDPESPQSTAGLG